MILEYEAVPGSLCMGPHRKIWDQVNCFVSYVRQYCLEQCLGQGGVPRRVAYAHMTFGYGLWARVGGGSSSRFRVQVAILLSGAWARGAVLSLVGRG